MDGHVRIRCGSTSRTTKRKLRCRREEANCIFAQGWPPPPLKKETTKTTTKIELNSQVVFVGEEEGYTISYLNKSFSSFPDMNRNYQTSLATLYSIRLKNYSSFSRIFNGAQQWSICQKGCTFLKRLNFTSQGRRRRMRWEEFTLHTVPWPIEKVHITRSISQRFQRSTAAADMLLRDFLMEHDKTYFLDTQ